MKKEEVEKKLRRMLRMYVTMASYGELLDKVLRPIFPDWLRVIRVEKYGTKIDEEEIV